MSVTTLAATYLVDVENKVPLGFSWHSSVSCGFRWKHIISFWQHLLTTSAFIFFVSWRALDGQETAMASVQRRSVCKWSYRSLRKKVNFHGKILCDISNDHIMGRFYATSPMIWSWDDTMSCKTVPNVLLLVVLWAKIARKINVPAIFIIVTRYYSKMFNLNTSLSSGMKFDRTW